MEVGASPLIELGSGGALEGVDRGGSPSIGPPHGGFLGAWGLTPLSALARPGVACPLTSRYSALGCPPGRLGLKNPD